jgi:hypothetical protein
MLTKVVKKIPNYLAPYETKTEEKELEEDLDVLEMMDHHLNVGLYLVVEVMMNVRL